MNWTIDVKFCFSFDDSITNEAKLVVHMNMHVSLVKRMLMKLRQSKFLFGLNKGMRFRSPFDI